MGIVISSATTQSGGGSAIAQAAAAARQALADAAVTAEQVDALINVGVFRDSNMVEPAIAALIQQQLGVGLEYRTGDVPCLSFDLMNGACGILNAVTVSQSLLAAPATHRVLIVSGDTHPSTRLDPDFPFAPVGAALLLESSDAAPGFGTLQVSAGGAVPEPSGYVDIPTMGSTGRSTLTVQRTTTTVLLEQAEFAARAALAADEIDVAEAVLVCGRPAPDFPQLLADRLGIETVVVTAEDSHTSALTAAYVAGRAEGRLTGEQPILFVTADSGPTAAAITYRES